VIILDTNVLSAIMRRAPDPMVVAWLDGLPPESIWTSSIMIFEARFGMALLPEGRRRRELEASFEAALREDIEGRIAPFDEAAAEAAATIAAAQRAAGLTVEFRDVEIAGIVTARRATLATRNTRHFEGTGIPIIDPWAS
jgi:predicted nucleic acid-binding protein